MLQTKVRKEYRRKRGFTLVELMLVIVILGILAAAAVNTFTGVSEDARITRAKTDIQTIQTAVRMFELEMGSFPTDDEGIDELTNQTEDHKAYLDKLPLDPWGNPYNYREESENDQPFPDIWSNGKDGEEGTDDDIGNWADEAEEEAGE